MKNVRSSDKYLFLRKEESFLIDVLIDIYYTRVITEEETDTIETYIQTICIDNRDISDWLWHRIRTILARHKYPLPETITTYTSNHYYKGVGNGKYFPLKDKKRKDGTIETFEERLAKRLAYRTKYYEEAEAKYSNKPRQVETQDVSEDAKMLNRVLKENQEMKDRIQALEDTVNKMAEYIQTEDKQPALKIVNNFSE